MLKILQARLLCESFNSMWTENFQMFKLDLEKAEEPEIKLPTFFGSLKILQARLQQYMNQELPDVQVGFRKGREARDQIANVRWIMQESSRRTSTPASLTMPKSLTVWITTNSSKFFKRWEYQATLPAFWEICMQVKKQQLELDKEQ